MTEPEEIIEARFIALLAEAIPHMDVLGALSPVPDGEQKLSDNTYVSVFVDLSAQEIDWNNPGLPCAWTARVVVHWANADDSSGNGFRDTCRAVRAVLDSYLGLNCTNFNDVGFECDDFQLSNTSTALDSDCYTKAYQLQVKGRYFPPTDSPQPETRNPQPT